ncbi:MAG: membrane protein insertase YidC [Proteobacteria bacterium]|nr:membrane protein insertase YidC [Pseudomonadota bacterium]
MDNQKLIQFVALAAILMLLWMKWEEANRPAPAPETVASQPADKTDKSVPSVPEVGTQTPQATPQVEAARPDTTKRGKLVRVRTDMLDISLDSNGADIHEVRLVKHAVSAKKPDEPFVLLTAEADERYITQTGFVGSGRKFPTHHTAYTSARSSYEMKPGQDELNVSFNWTAGDGVKYEKRYTFHRNSYLVDISYRINNRSSSKWVGHLYSQFLRRAPSMDGGLMRLPTYVGGAIYTPEEQYEKISFDDLDDDPLKRSVKGGWVGMLQHYFVASWMPPQDSENIFFAKPVGNGEYVYGMTRKSVEEIGIGKQGEIKTQLYIGTKEHDLLKDLPEGMDLTVDFGWLTFISAPLFWVLVNIHKLVGNWGWAIILLTVLIKAVFFPLSAASYKSMAKMRAVQPKIKSLKDRLGSDKERFNKEMMSLYKTEKINPLGGCLPILIQIPVFIALYWVLLESVEMRHAPFALWLTDLSSPDPYFVLPLIMGASMFVQHHLNPAPVDPMQKKIMQFLPVIFTVFFLFFPAGLVLYWVVNNILSIAQQWQITKMVESGKR